MSFFVWTVRGRFAVGSAGNLGSTPGSGALYWDEYEEDPSEYPWPDPRTWPPARILGVGFTLNTGTGILARRPVLRLTSPELGMVEHRALGTTPGPAASRRYEFWPGYERNATAASVALYREPWPHDAVLHPSALGVGSFVSLTVENFVLGQDNISTLHVSLELLLP